MKRVLTSSKSVVNDIADDFKLSRGVVKLIYIVYIENSQDNSKLNTRMIDFVPKQTVKQVMVELADRLAKVLY